MVFLNCCTSLHTCMSQTYQHTHTHTLTAFLTPVLHATLPSGPVISKRTRKTERCESAAWTLQSCLLLNLLCVCVCVCVCVDNFLSPGLPARTNRPPSCLSACARACVLTVSSFAKEMSLRRPPARRHSSP